MCGFHMSTAAIAFRAIYLNMGSVISALVATYYLLAGCLGLEGAVRSSEKSMNVYRTP
jgi:hypothetical protein